MLYKKIKAVTKRISQCYSFFYFYDIEKKKFIKIGTATEHNTPLITDIIINSSLLYFISIGSVVSSLVAPAAAIATYGFKYFTNIGIIIKGMST